MSTYARSAADGQKKSAGTPRVKNPEPQIYVSHGQLNSSASPRLKVKTLQIRAITLSKRHRKMHRFKLIFRSYNTLNSSATTTGPLVSRLKSRSVIRFGGPDTIKFLQGLLTNDVRRFDKPPDEGTSSLPTPNMPTVSQPPMYAALLTPQGRFLYDLFLYRPPRAGEKLDSTGSGPGSDNGDSVEMFADVDSSVLDELLQTLKRWALFPLIFPLAYFIRFWDLQVYDIFPFSCC